MAKAIEPSRSSPNPLEKIKLALTEMIIFRRAEPDKLTLELFSRRLAQENLEDVITALQQIQELPREEFESAIPCIADIVAVVKAAGIARISRETNGKRSVLVGYECPKCKYRTADFLEPDHYPKRYCRRCPTAMNEIHRENL